MKTLYISDSMAKLLKENILKDTLPSDIVDAAASNKTSIGNNPAIPDIFDKPYILKIAMDRFEETKMALKEIGEINEVNDTELNGALSHLILKCKELEAPHRDELEKICMNYLIDFFGIPEESVQIKLGLVDKIDLNDESIILEPTDDSGEIELMDLNDAMSIKKEVYKRRILDVLSMGAAMNISSNIDSYKDQISSIDPQLCDLYKKVISLNNYLLFEKEDIGMNDRNKMQLGTVTLSLGNEETKSEINAQGVIFPILLSEAIRGFVDLFISHGLPEERNRAISIIGKSDFLKAEPWDMRIGPTLWTLLSNSFNDINSQELPYLLKRISCLEVNKFNFLMKEIFAKTRKGREIMSVLSSKAKNDGEYERFVDKMNKMKNDKGVITDEFIHPEEL